MIVKELFYSIQGEGYNSGRPAVFCRFSGCNLWSGEESRKSKSPCFFCDTDFVGGTKYTEDSLLTAIKNLMPDGLKPMVIFTGGEPLLQLTGTLIDKVKSLGVNVAIETNGTLPLPKAGPYWSTVSPKVLRSLAVTRGNELKLLFPLPSLKPAQVEHLDFDYFTLQPIHDEKYKENLEGAIEYCLLNPKWRLSTQQHKVWGLR